MPNRSILSNLLFHNAISMFIIVVAIVGYGWYNAKNSEQVIGQEIKPIIELAARFRMEAEALKVVQPLQAIFQSAYVVNRFHTQVALQARKKALAGTPMRSEVNQIVRLSTEAWPNVSSTYLTLELNSFDNKDSEYTGDQASGSSTNGRFSPYWVRDEDGNVSSVQEGENVITDETPQVAHPINWWYTCPKQNHKVCVVDPYLYEGVLMASVVNPMMDSETYVGGAGTDLSLSFLSKTIHDANLQIYDGLGRILLISQDGVIAGDSKMQEQATSAATFLGERYPFVQESIKNGQTHFSANTATQMVTIVQPFTLAEGASTWAVYMEMPISTVLAEQDVVEALLTKERNSTIIGQVIVALGIVFITLFFAWKILRHLTTPLKQVAEIIQNITKNNDLTKQLPVTSKDEVGTLADNLNQFFNKLRQLMNDMKKSSETVRFSSEQSTKRTAANAQRLSSQHNEVIQIVASMNELSASANSIADNAERAEQSADFVRQSVTKGCDVMEASTAKVANLAENIEKAIEAIEDMKNESHNIAQIINTINGIAEQTNLLALNASIEAARAGEHGRGFAVVAEEVRHLANSVQKSTQEISKVVQGLTTKTSDVVAAINEGRARMAETVELSNAAEDALNIIKDSVNEISDMNSRIASAVKEQSLVTQNLDHNLANIGIVIDELVSNSAVANTASTDLNQQAEYLNKQMSQFLS